MKPSILAPDKEPQPFHEIDWYRNKYEEMENTVSLLKEDIRQLRECVRLLMLAENYRLERAIKK